MKKRTHHSKPGAGGKRRAQGKPGPGKGPADLPAVRRSGGSVQVRRVAGQQAWEFVHPRCSLERADDLAEVHEMLAHGETEIAMDELRWLLGGCPDFIEAHALLGELALGENDLTLARGHFGHAFRVGEKALLQQGNPSPLPYARPTNQAFYTAGKGLVWCLLKLGKTDLAKDVIDQMLASDPSDPLRVADLQNEPPACGLGQ